MRKAARGSPFFFYPFSSYLRPLALEPLVLLLALLALEPLLVAEPVEALLLFELELLLVVAAGRLLLELVESLTLPLELLLPVRPLVLLLVVAAGRLLLELVEPLTLPLELLLPVRPLELLPVVAEPVEAPLLLLPELMLPPLALGRTVAVGASVLPLLGAGATSWLPG